MFKVFGVRQGMIGDSIMALPILNYLDQKYPNSYKYWCIGKKFSQSAPLYISQKLIDKIWILENDELMGKKDIEEAKKCDLFINPNPQHPDVEDWWNHFSCTEETFRMAGFDLKEFHQMENHCKKPKLEPWFKYQKYSNTIAVWPFAHYGKDKRRNPTPEWWKILLKEIEDVYKFNIFHFGAEDEPDLGEGLKNYKKLTQLSFFEMIKITLGCNLSIGTDSGSSWVIGAYGMPQINILTKWMPYHITNFCAFSPENYLNNKIDHISLNGTDDIIHTDVINSISNIKTI